MAEWPAAAGEAERKKQDPPLRRPLCVAAPPPPLCIRCTPWLPINGVIDQLGRGEMALITRHLTNTAMAEGRATEPDGPASRGRAERPGRARTNRLPPFRAQSFKTTNSSSRGSRLRLLARPSAPPMLASAAVVLIADHEGSGPWPSAAFRSGRRDREETRVRVFSRGRRAKPARTYRDE
jgi:hypothetical protein